jgi:hypothetical protein
MLLMPSHIYRYALIQVNDASCGACGTDLDAGFEYGRVIREPNIKAQ